MSLLLPIGTSLSPIAMPQRELGKCEVVALLREREANVLDQLVPDPDVRREWLQRIVDHDGARPGEGGIELWIRLGVALGVPREEMEDERHVLPAVRLICESYVTFCKSKPWQEACASGGAARFGGLRNRDRGRNGEG